MFENILGNFGHNYRFDTNWNEHGGVNIENGNVFIDKRVRIFKTGKNVSSPSFDQHVISKISVNVYKDVLRTSLEHFSLGQRLTFLERLLRFDPWFFTSLLTGCAELIVFTVGNLGGLVLAICDAFGFNIIKGDVVLNDYSKEIGLKLKNTGRYFNRRYFSIYGNFDILDNEKQ